MQEEINCKKRNHTLIVRVDIEQKRRLEALANASGYKNVSDYVRQNLLNPSIELKINRILELLQNKNKTVGDKNEK